MFLTMFNSQFYSPHFAIYVVIKMFIESRVTTIKNFLKNDYGRSGKKDEVEKKYIWYMENKNETNLSKYLEFVGLVNYIIII